MKHAFRTLAALLAAVILLSAPAESASPPEDNEGIIPVKGQPLFYVKEYGTWHLYNDSGEQILPFPWVWTDAEMPDKNGWGGPLSTIDGDTVMRVKFGRGGYRRYGYIDLEGNFVIPADYLWLDYFQGELVGAQRDDGQYGVINRANQWLLDTEGEPYYDWDEYTGVYEINDLSYRLDEDGLKPVSTVSTEVDFDPYYAHEGEKTPRLDDPASLKLSEPLPVIDGAKAVFPYYSGVVEAVYPEDVRFGASDAYVYNNTPGAYERVVSGEDDIIIVAQPSDEQRAAAEEAGAELEFTPIMREAFVFFVPEDSPVDGLTVDQIRGIYSGRITDWAELGAPELGGIVAYQRNEGSGSQTALEKLMGDTPLMEPPTEDIETGFMEFIVHAVEYKNTPNAIGFSFRWFVTDMMNSGVKLLALDGAAPTEENIANGTYPVIADVYAVTRRDEDNPNVRLLLDWMLSDEGQELVRRSGYVPVK